MIARRFFPLFMALSTLLSVVGCGINQPFVLMDDGYQIKPSSIAIVAGNNTPSSVKLAEVLTKSMKEKTAFRILGQDAIHRRIPKYPLSIATTIPKDGSKPVWFEDTEKAKLDAIQKKLKVSYLFVVWGDHLSMQTACAYGGGCNTYYYMTVIGNLIEYPKGRPISFTHIEEKDTPHLYKLTVFKSNNYFVDSMIDDAVGKITEEIASSTGAKG